MLRLRRLLPLAIVAPLAGFSLAGCASLNDLCYETKQKKRACDAWQCYAAENCSTKFSKDYKLGYKAGYYDVLTGGSGCPPVIAPKCYWDPGNVLKYCDERRNEWYRGWQDGAAHAKGQPDTHYLKTFLPPCCPPQAARVYGSTLDVPPAGDFIPPATPAGTVEDLAPPAGETPLPDLKDDANETDDAEPVTAPEPDEDEAKDRVDELMKEAEKLRRKDAAPADPKADAPKPYFEAPKTPIPEATPESAPLPKPEADTPLTNATPRTRRPTVESFDFGSALGSLSGWREQAARVDAADRAVDVQASAGVEPLFNAPQPAPKNAVTPIGFQTPAGSDPVSDAFNAEQDNAAHPADSRYFEADPRSAAPSASEPLAVPLFGHELRAKFRGSFRGAVKPQVAAADAKATRKVEPTQTAAR